LEVWQSLITALQSRQLVLTMVKQRADTVPEFLISPGLSPNAITAKGVGRDNPVSDGSTATGRKQNRPVEAYSEP
jgi:outer membrane protein OmpA-like peptidoglycan-associated protein